MTDRMNKSKSLKSFVKSKKIHHSFGLTSIWMISYVKLEKCYYIYAKFRLISSFSRLLF